MSIIQHIKELAHKATEDYVIHDTPPNESIDEMIKNGSVENEEILKRICEVCNQSIYLSLFNKSDVDRSNIIFDYADFKQLKDAIKTRENHMSDYLTPPKDFKRSGELTFIIQPKEEVKEASAAYNLKEIQKVAHDLNKLILFKSSIETLKADEVKTVEQAFEIMSDQTKEMVLNGDSLGDIAKIASRHVHGAGLSFEKVAKAYELIGNNIRKSGFDVETAFTKVSSQAINVNAPMLDAVEDFVMSIEKIAACGEMHGKVDKHIKAYKKVLKNVKRY